MPRALLAALFLLAAVEAASAADIALSVEIPAAKARTARLRHLPAGGQMAVRIASSGRLLVALVSEKQMRSPESRRGPPLFRAVVERSLTFRVVIPEAGNYLLVLSNRGGSGTLTVRVQIRAVRPGRGPAPRGGERTETPAMLTPA